MQVFDRPCRRATAVQVAFEVFPVDGSNIQAMRSRLDCRVDISVLQVEPQSNENANLSC